jgi:hypothetical protein
MDRYAVIDHPQVPTTNLLSELEYVVPGKSNAFHVADERDHSEKHHVIVRSPLLVQH